MLEPNLEQLRETEKRVEDEEERTSQVKAQRQEKMVELYGTPASSEHARGQGMKAQ